MRIKFGRYTIDKISTSPMVQPALILKLDKHIKNNEPERVRDYLLCIAGNIDINFASEDLIIKMKQGVEFLRNNGYTVYLGNDNPTIEKKAID